MSATVSTLTAVLSTKLTDCRTAAKDIVATEGPAGSFRPRSPTRLMTNGLQGLLFSILWKLFADL